ncbi:hypothetical protein T265_15688 [Opisthorchis viverrini]|uniref:RRM domain-containing protein n=1 Tax=Opisthorchis viverrini TaxID=6198 RepID=A0A074YW94_OPIVI|nr:hypothetical protein T265_15688 [Opisthorchis viverrini]KER19046.1 hypothetical protein T265_15688 [Opisthorchis viverrini]
MQSTGRDSIRASKKRRHSHGLDGTPVSEKKKELSHTVSRNATISRTPKRVHEEDNEELSNTANAVLQSPGSPTVKRPRKKPSLLGSSDLQKYEGMYTSTTEVTSQPGQKVALLSMIRQRLEFKSEESARNALKSIVGKLIADRPIKAELCFERSNTETNPNADRGQKKSGEKPIQWSKPNERQLRDFSLTTLHVSCVPRNTTPDEVRQLFPQAVSFDFNMHPKDKGIGSCRVAFSSEQDAFQAFTSQHNAIIRDCPIIVNFAFKKHKPTGNVLQTVNTRIPSTQLIGNKHKSSMKVDEQSKEKLNKAHTVFCGQQKKPQSTTETTTEPKQKKKQKKSLSGTSLPNDFPFPKQPKAKKHKLTCTRERLFQQLECSDFVNTLVFLKTFHSSRSLFGIVDRRWGLYRTVNMEPLKASEVHDCMCSLERHRASGPDDLPPALFKDGGEVVSQRLSDLFASIWEKETVPQNWGESVIVPISKKGARSESGNHRGISLTPVVTKLLASLVLRRLTTLTREQPTGFRPGGGCVDQIFTFLQVLEQRHTYKRPTVLVYPDLQGAFDSVNWSVLEKVAHRGMPRNFLNIVSCLYSPSIPF